MNTILVVDDDPDTRDFLSVALSAEGSVVQTTSTLLGAIDILKANSEIDCMLLDYNLPGMPMEDFLTAARGISPKIGIVLISAADKVGERAAKVGLKHFLGKPFQVDELRKIMKECVASAAGECAGP